MRTVGELDELLKQQGIPIIGVTLHKRGPPAVSSIRFAPEATQAQKNSGNAFREAFDWEGSSQIPEAAMAAASRVTKKKSVTKAKRKT
jgi:hypothetical protein